MLYLAPSFSRQFFDHDGEPLRGGKLYTYAAGTLTPLPAYTSRVGDVPHANPITLDDAGMAPIFLPAGVAYKFVIKDSSGNEIDTEDYVTVPEPTSPSAVPQVPSGAVLPYGASVAPSGYLLCDGSAVSRSTYADLFAIIGTTFGAGNGSTTFNVPDLRGRFMLFKAAAGTGSTLGGSGGSLDHAHSISTDGLHSHTIPSQGGHSHGGVTGAAGSHDHGGSTGINSSLTGVTGGGDDAARTDHLHSIDSVADHTHSIGADGSHDHGGTTGSNGQHSHGNTTGTNNPAFLTFNAIIKT